MILYLHGFRSSPKSFKARLLGEQLNALGLATVWRCPQLPESPLQAIALAETVIGAVAANEPVTLIGSSLGGFYATCLAERHGLRAVLLNPATAPERDLRRHLGRQPLWHGGGSVLIEPHHLDELRALTPTAITCPERYYLIAATGDEVLDYREMLSAYPGVRTTLIQGGDHGLSEFPAYMNSVLQFCGVDAPVKANPDTSVPAANGDWLGMVARNDEH